MKRQFSITVVLAILAQNSLARMTPASTEIHNQIVTDYSTICGLNQVAIEEYMKVATTIFDCLENSARTMPGTQNPPMEGSCLTNTSKVAVLNALTTHFSVTLLAIQTVNSGDYSGISAAREAGLSEIEKFVEAIFRGIVLIRNGKSSKNLAKIDALETETLAAVERMNAVIYGAFQYGNTAALGIQGATRSAQERSLVQLDITVKSVYTGIRALLGVLPSGAQAGSGSKLATIRSARNEAASALEAEIGIRYSFMYNVFISLSIIQLRTVTNVSAIHALELREMSDCRAAMNITFPMPQSIATEVVPEIENETENEATSDALVDSGEEVAQSGSRFGNSMIFETMIFEFTRVSNGYEDEIEEECSVTALSKKNEYLVFKTAIDSYFNSTALVKPEATPIVRSVQSATYYSLIESVRGIKQGIELFRMKNCSDMPAILEAIEEATISAAASVTVNVFIPIKYGHKSDSQIGAAIDRAQEKAVSLIVEICRSIFKAIKIFLTGICPESDFEVDDCSSSVEAVEDLENRSDVLMSAVVTTIYGAIRTIFKASSDQDIDSCTQ